MKRLKELSRKGFRDKFGAEDRYFAYLAKAKWGEEYTCRKVFICTIGIRWHFYTDTYCLLNTWRIFQSPRNHYRGSGCPKWNSSKGEGKIRHILTSLQIEFEEQKTFESLVHKNKLKCDFYLPKLNIVIEYNGIQHYEPISVFGGIEGLKESQKRDIIKYNFLKEKNIKLIIIRYNIDDIELYLTKRLSVDN